MWGGPWGSRTERASSLRAAAKQRNDHTSGRATGTSGTPEKRARKADRPDTLHMAAEEILRAESKFDDWGRLSYTEANYLRALAEASEAEADSGEANGNPSAGEESLRLHEATEELLRKKGKIDAYGKRTYTEDDYVRALHVVSGR